MIAFEISVDDERVCTAGVGDRGVLSLIATWVRRPARDMEPGTPIGDRFEEELTLSAGGLRHDTDGTRVDVRWIEQALHVGQRVTFTVIDTAQVDAPVSERREAREDIEGQKRAYYERLKRELGEA